MSAQNTFMVTGGLGFLAKSMLSRVLSGNTITHQLWMSNAKSNINQNAQLEKILLVDNKSNPGCDEPIPSIVYDDSGSLDYYYYSIPSVMLNPADDPLDGEMAWGRSSNNNSNAARVKRNIQTYVKYVNADISNQESMAELIRIWNVRSILNLAGTFIQNGDHPRSYYDDLITKPALALLEEAMKSDVVTRFVQPVIETAHHFYDGQVITLHPFVKSQQRMIMLMEALFQEYEANTQDMNRKFELVFVSIPIADLPSAARSPIIWLMLSAVNSHPAFSKMVIMNGDSRRNSTLGYMSAIRNYHSQSSNALAEESAVAMKRRRIKDRGVPFGLFSSFYLQSSDTTALAPSDVIGLALYSIANLYCGPAFDHRYFREDVLTYLQHSPVYCDKNIISSAGGGGGVIFKIPLSNQNWADDYNHSQYLSNLIPGCVSYYMNEDDALAIPKLDLGIKSGIPRVTLPSVYRINTPREDVVRFERLYSQLLPQNASYSSEMLHLKCSVRMGPTYPLMRVAEHFLGSDVVNKQVAFDFYSMDGIGSPSGLTEMIDWGVPMSPNIEDEDR